MHDDHFRPIRTYSSSSIPQRPSSSRSSSSSSIVSSVVPLSSQLHLVKSDERTALENNAGASVNEMTPLLSRANVPKPIQTSDTHRHSSRRISTCPSPPVRPSPTPVVEIEHVSFTTGTAESIKSEDEGGGCCCGLALCWKGIDVLGEQIAKYMYAGVRRESHRCTKKLLDGDSDRFER